MNKENFDAMTNFLEDVPNRSNEKMDDFENHQVHFFPIEHRSNREDVEGDLLHYQRLRYHLERAMVTKQSNVSKRKTKTEFALLFAHAS